MALIDGYSSQSDDEIDSSVKRDIQLIQPQMEYAPAVKIVAENIELNKTAKSQNHLQTVFIDKGHFNNKRKAPEKKNKKKQKRNKGSLEDVYQGPWASFEEDHQSEDEKVVEKETIEETQPADLSDTESIEDSEKHTTEYFATFKYATNFMDVPQLSKINLEKLPGSQECFAPKKVIHKFLGHTSGVSKIKFFPVSGHLLLSCGNDSVIRLWSLYNKKELVREYYGHTQTVKDIAFNSDGTLFLSCSFDKKIVLWKTETGEMLLSMDLTSVASSVIFNPNNNKEFLVGLMNSNIEHYTIEESFRLLQTYDHHVGSINTLCVIQNGSKFLSASDDKSIRIWNWGINIPVKAITHPTQYAISSAVTIPPNEEYIAVQNMNNAIQVIDGDGKFKFKKKTFRNNYVTGYKVEIDRSPDGKILLAGDSKGNILFWDWKSGNLVRKLNVSNKVINSVKFHPQEQSKVAAAGADGCIYYCD